MMQKLTSDTVIRLSQIKGLKEWHNSIMEDSLYKPGDISKKTGLQKQPDGSWKPPVDYHKKDKWSVNIHKVTSVNNINESEFENPTRSILLPPISRKFTKAIGKNCKGLLLTKHTIERMKKKHPEMKDGINRRKILNNALNNFTTVLYDRPSERPNYYVVVKNGNHYDMSVIDTDSKQEFFEVVDWRKIDQAGYDEMIEKMEEEDGQFLITDGKIRTGQPTDFLLFSSNKETITRDHAEVKSLSALFYQRKTSA